MRLEAGGLGLHFVTRPRGVSRMMMNLTTEDDIRDFEIFNVSDVVNVLAYSTMAIGKGSRQNRRNKQSVKFFTLWVLTFHSPKSVKFHMVIKIFLCISGRIRPF